MNPKKVYLAQTDTTVGFLSQDTKRLAHIKGRPASKPFLIAVASLRLLQKFARVPKTYKNRVRRSKRTTFVYPNNQAVRIVQDTRHKRFLQKFGWMYSTSANRSGKHFDRDFAYHVADIIVEDSRGFFEGEPSSLIKLGRKRAKRLR